VVELGGEWIDSSQESVRQLAEELSLSMVDTGQDFITRDLIGQSPIPEDEHRRVVEALFDVIEALGPRRVEAMTASDLLEQVGEAGAAMTVLRSRLEGTFGVTLDRIAAADLDEEFGLVQASSYLRIEGGNDRLARTMADSLDVMTSTPVRTVRQTSATVEIVTDDSDLTADHAVIATPLPVVADPGFLVDAPHAVAGALSELAMGTAAKIAVATLDEPPMLRRQEDAIPAWYWTGAGPDGATRMAVTGFAGTARGVAVLTAEAPERLARAVPETPLSGAPLIVDWGADPWSRGCYSALGPGQRDVLPALAAPFGRLVLAGEHVNGSGTIDGAIRSGETAARHLLERT
jgi:monoamine oxidase